jgi:hypothetical protein
VTFKAPRKFFFLTYFGLLVFEETVPIPTFTSFFKAVFRIRIHMFLGLQDPDPDPLVRGMDPAPAPDPSIFMQKIVSKTLIPYIL